MAAKLNVQSFPRPPRLERTWRHLRITYQGREIADTRDAYWVLETHHPPSLSSLLAIHSLFSPVVHTYPSVPVAKMRIQAAG